MLYKGLSTHRVMLYTLGRLYEQGKISSGVGARILGCDRWTFYRQITECGFAVIDYAPEDMANEASEAQASQRLKPLAAMSSRL